MNSRTTTSVHSVESMMRQRNSAFMHDQYALTGVSLFTQIVIGCCIYLNDHVGTPGYLCVLLLLGPAALFYVLTAFLQRRTPLETGTLPACLGRTGGRLGAGLLALCCLMDAQLAAFSLCAVMSEILPDVSSFWVALSALLLTGFAMGGRGVHALPRLSHLMRWVLILFLIWPLLAAVPQGEAGHLFPLLGKGPSSVLTGGLWMSGCVSQAVFPWILPQREAKDNRMREKGGLGTLLCAVLLGALFSFAASFLLPFYALSRPESLGWRLLLFGTLSPSLIGWTLNVWGILFFLLFGLSTGAARAAELLAGPDGRKSASPFLLPALLLLLLPLSALQTDEAENLLMLLSPLRAAVTLGLLLLMLLGYGFRKKAGRKA